MAENSKIEWTGAADAMAPVRLQLSRRKGFSLQAASRALNGLDAILLDLANRD